MPVVTCNVTHVTCQREENRYSLPDSSKSLRTSVNYFDYFVKRKMLFFKREDKPIRVRPCAQYSSTFCCFQPVGIAECLARQYAEMDAVVRLGCASLNFCTQQPGSPFVAHQIHQI